PHEIGNPESDDERVHLGSGAEDAGEHLIPHEAEDAAGKGGEAGGRGGAREGRRRQAPSLRRTSSLTALPSTVCPASFAIAAFITRPMSFADAAPVSAMASVTARSSAAGSIAGGR